MEYVSPALSAQQVQRIERLKQNALAIEQEVCVERARYVTQAYQKYQADPMIIRGQKRCGMY